MAEQSTNICHCHFFEHGSSVECLSPRHVVIFFMIYSQSASAMTMNYFVWLVFCCTISVADCFSFNLLVSGLRLLVFSTTFSRNFVLSFSYKMTTAMKTTSTLNVRLT